MSQVTCCPSCGTRFKVVSDQLRLSEGWVRCGHCQALFDAMEHLEGVPDAADAAPGASQQASPSMPDPAPGDEAGEPSQSLESAQAAAPMLDDSIQSEPDEPDTLPIVLDLPTPAEDVILPPDVPSALSAPSPADVVEAAPTDPSPSEDAMQPAQTPQASVSVDEYLPSVAAGSAAMSLEREDGSEYAALDPDALQWPEPEELGILRKGTDVPIVDTTRASGDPDDPDIPPLGIPAYRPQPARPSAAPQPAAPVSVPPAPDWDAVAADLERTPVKPPVPEPELRPASVPDPGRQTRHAAPPARPQPEDIPSTVSLGLQPGRSEPTLHRDTPVPPAVPPASPPASAPATAQERGAAAEEGSGEMVNLQVPSFIRKAQRKAFWRKGWVRAVLSVLAVVLVLLLGAQWAVHQRDHLAASQPNWRPALEQLCAWWQCTIAAPKDIQQVTVESSSFQKKRDGAYAVELTLANKSATDVAFPAVELSLTDASERTVLRRVILATQWPQPAPKTLASRAEWVGQLQIQLSAEDAALVTGYRALIFYP